MTESRPPLASRQLYRIFIRDLVVPWSIGIHDHEHIKAQRIQVNIDLQVLEPEDFEADRYRNVICYADIVEGIRKLADSGHVNLVETLANRITVLCLVDPRAESVSVRIEKLDAISGAAGVGVEIQRDRTDIPRPE
ncbi:MAG: dihydroneopterin aldolase [Alphaproteobacteria bacterium]|nr:dihydroneopterin aldolase [Alphaproteobacteria bacterium]